MTESIMTKDEERKATDNWSISEYATEIIRLRKRCEYQLRLLQARDKEIVELEMKALEDKHV